MRTIYLDDEFKCHISDDGSMTAVETDAFDDKCTEFIEGHRLKPSDEIWVRSDGFVFSGGEMITPWKPSNELDAAQREYERQKLAEYEALIDELYAEVTE